jgi:hypothetical protein
MCLCICSVEDRCGVERAMLHPFMRQAAIRETCRVSLDAVIRQRVFKATGVDERDEEDGSLRANVRRAAL